MARRGPGDDPPVEPPRLLRPLVTFSRLPARALETVRRALEEDPEFRARVAAEGARLEQAGLDRSSWLFLSRPPGWEDELRHAGDAARLAAELEREDREERAARRQLRAALESASRAEDAAREARAALAAARARAARLAEELAAERAARAGAEEQVTGLRAAVAGLEAWRDDAGRRVAELEAKLADSERRAADAAAHGAPGPVHPEATDAAAAEVVAATRAAARTAAGLSSELDRIVEAVEMGLGRAGAGGGSRAPEPAAARRVPSQGPGEREEPQGSDRPAPSAHRRQPIRLPPGLLEEAPESAEHLVRTNGVVLVVDGYNVSYACWPTLAIAEQRDRLADALRELAARTGVDVEIVFDGGEHRRHVLPSTTRQPVRIRFSPPGTEADDVILEMVEMYPPHRPVVVATSDRRVREGVRQRGANVISAGQLLKVLRRERGW